MILTLYHHSVGSIVSITILQVLTFNSHIHHTCTLTYVQNYERLHTCILRGHVDDHLLHVHVYIAPTMLTELLYPLQCRNTPLHLAAEKGHTACVEHLLSTPGIDVNIQNRVSWSI